MGSSPFVGAFALAGSLVLVGCPSPAPDDGVCGEATERLGHRPCAHSIPDRTTWEGLTVSAGATGQLNATKYTTPARADARLPTLYLDSNHYILHYEFFVDAFGDLFPALSPVDYLSLILDPENREFYAGFVSEYLVEGGSIFGFTVWDDPADPSTAVQLADVEAAWQALQPTFGLGDLAFVPSSQRQRSDAAGWDAPFPIHDPDGIDYEVYTPATGYGTVRLVPIEELAAAVAEAAFGLQDILVLDDAPLDVERVVSGAVTGGRQNELSHLNIRSAARGTPNCYLRDPFTALAQWEGELVELTCGAEELVVETATTEEAEAFWDQLRPDPVDVPPPDLEWSALTPLLEVPTETTEERAVALARHGAKGTGLATLYQRIDPDLQLQGFVVPFHHYAAFVETNSWTPPDQAEPETFAETLARWHADEDFLTDGALRHDRLDALRTAMRAAPMDAALVAELGARIEATWGDPERMVRFRSSSNAEDSLRFSGAGLYDSTSACLADELDGDDAGPSRCDPDQSNERTVTRALGKVWASLWALGAWEERQWFGIDPGSVAMGVLVNDRSAAEQASIVAFSGNPIAAGDDRFVVTAQAGEASVVSPQPGEVTEKSLLTVEGGEVVTIERVRASSEVPVGSHVLDDDRLRELGAALAEIVDVLPIDEAPPEGASVLLDTEWKVLEDGRLVVKQARPFLRQD